MHGRRVATGVALLISVGSLTPLPAAHAATGTTLYVNNAVTSCSDNTADSSVTPYCTIPAAMNAVTPGETIMLAGIYPPFSVTKSGTAGQPITIEGPTSAVTGSAPLIATNGSTANDITITGASFVTVANLRLASNGSTVAISGSDHITLDGLQSRQPSASQAPQIQALASSNVTLSRSLLRGGSTAATISITGGSADTITTNALENYVGTVERPGIVLNGVTSSAITSNDVSPWCGYGISVSNGSTSTTIENNVLAQLTGPTAIACPAATDSSPNIPLSVDSSSTPGSKADYNDVNAASDTKIAYSWGGGTYADAGSFAAATSQGTHDSNSVTSVSGIIPSDSVTIDSADSSAPGELSTDVMGHPRVDDPLVADTGSGTPAYHDRGAVEYVDPITATFSSSVPRALTGVPVTVSASVTDPWSVANYCRVDFGDGTVTDQVPVTNGSCSASHAYTAAGTFFPAVTVTNSYGGLKTVNGTIATAVPKPFLPKLAVSPVGGLSVEADASASTAAWPITDYKFDFGDGSVVDGYSALDTDHPYAKAGTYTVTVTETDLDGDTASTSAQFTTAASYYTPVSPVRILDTRKGIGVPAVAKVPANGTLSLNIAGVAGVPQTGLRAVALNVTVVNPTQTGYITAYPADAAQPATSNLDFTPGRTFANSVIVKVGANGSVNFKNGSGGSVDLVADLAGYYSDDSTYGYTSVSPIRLLDTRKSASTIAANGVHKLYVGNYTGAAAVALNVTVTNPKQGGYLTAYPDGENRPVVSNLDFMAGQTIANQVIVKVGADGYVDFANSSAGSTDLIVDIDGYFRSGAGSFFTPITPTRAWDLESVGVGTTDVPIGYDAGSSDLWGLRGGSIAANLTVANPSDGGYLSAYPDDEATPPTISAIDFPANETVTNAATVTLGSQNYGIDLHLAESGVARLIVDVFGYYSTT